MKTSLRTLILRGLVIAGLVLAVSAQACGDDDTDSPGDGTATGEVSGTATPAWTVYEDEVSGATFPIPGDASALDSSSEITLLSAEKVQSRILSFISSAGLLYYSFASTPNPEGKTLEDWITVYARITAESDEVTVAGIEGVIYEQPAEGNNDAVVYWQDGDTILALQGKTSDANGPQNLSREDFDRVLEEIDFE